MVTGKMTGKYHWVEGSTGLCEENALQIPVLEFFAGISA
jgi:hypothetical protein